MNIAGKRENTNTYKKLKNKRVMETLVKVWEKSESLIISVHKSKRS